MPDLGPHADHILGSYAIVFGVLAALIGWLVVSSRRNHATLARLERQSSGRRRGTSARQQDASPAASED